MMMTTTTTTTTQQVQLVDVADLLQSAAAAAAVACRVRGLVGNVGDADLRNEAHSEEVPWLRYMEMASHERANELDA